MTRQRAQIWMLGLLPLLVVRLLLPSGVMPAYANHGVALVLCSPQHLQTAPQQRHSHADTPCPFAAAASAAPAAAPLPLALAAVRTALGSPLRTAQCPVQAATTRVQSARGPPSFSEKS